MYSHKCIASFPGFVLRNANNNYVKFSLGRRLNFANFVVLWLFAKDFSAKFGSVASLAW